MDEQNSNANLSSTKGLLVQVSQPLKLNADNSNIHVAQMSPNSVQKAQRISTAPNPNAKEPFTFVEQSALDRLKNIQNFIKRNWQGVQTEYSGRPGTSNIVNKKRYNPVSEVQIEDEDRFRTMLKMVTKIQDIIDEDKINSKQQTTSVNFYNHDSQNKNNNISEFLTFKTIKENQLLSSAPPALGYAKSYQVENSELLYKIFRGETRLVRSMLEANGFQYTESHEWNILWSNGSCKSYLYEGLNEHQKINHFPSSNELTRKDKLCQNVRKMQEKFGKQAFDFIPDTYVLPDEFGEFYTHFQKLKQTEGKQKNLWIIKPANLSRGRGIYLVDDISEVSVDDTSVASKYINNPLLINGHKFDLRIYVVVTSFEPLKIYVYKEGLARFASEQYTTKFTKDNKFVHLTNYSINKKNDNFQQNENLENDDQGFKWSLSAFCKHLEQIGIDMNLFWSRIFDVILKSIISGENQIFQSIKKTCIHRTNCFELFGYDILIDSDLKPWLIEINLSPSLACESILDLTIKSNLIADTLHMVGMRRFDRRQESQNKMKNRMKSYMNRGNSMMSSKYAHIFNPLKDRNNTLGGGVFGISTSGIGYNQTHENFYQQINTVIMAQLAKACDHDIEIKENFELARRLCSIKHKDILKETLAEYQRKGNFVRIYPAKGSDAYDQYFTQHRPLNKFIYKMLYTDELAPMKATQSVAKLNYKLEIPQSYDYYRNKQKNNNLNQSETLKSDSSDLIKPSTQNLKINRVAADKDTAEKVQQVNQNKAKNDLESLAQNLQKEIQSKQRSISSAVPRNRKNFITDELSQRVIDNSNYLQPITEVKNQKKNEKVLITGDDILIEYCERIHLALKQVNEQQMRSNWKQQLEEFISHKVWTSNTDSENTAAKQLSYVSKFEPRITEMKERRKRLIKMIYKKEGRLSDFEHGYKSLLIRKQAILRKFPNAQIEHFLKSSTKNIAQEVVGKLISQQEGQSHGLLVELENAGFNALIKPQDENSSMILPTNAETEDEQQDVSFLNHKQRMIGKQPSKKIIFNGQSDQRMVVVKGIKSNNFFKDTLVSPSSENMTEIMSMRNQSASIKSKMMRQTSTNSNGIFIKAQSIPPRTNLNVSKSNHQRKMNSSNDTMQHLQSNQRESYQYQNMNEANSQSKKALQGPFQAFGYLSAATIKSKVISNEPTATPYQQHTKAENTLYKAVGTIKNRAN